MKSVTSLTVFLLVLVGIFQTFEGVSGRTTHESGGGGGGRKRRQVVVTARNYNINNNNNKNDDYSYDPYFLSSSPSFRRQSRHGDNSDLIASSNSVVSNSLLPEGIVSVGGGSKSRDYYDPFYYFVPASAAYVGSRSRRNSHGSRPPLPPPSQLRRYQMSPSSAALSYPKNDQQREVAYLYERNSKADNNIFPHQPLLSPSSSHRFQHRNPNQFLTKQQITSSQARYNPTLARYYFPSGNSIDNTNRNYYDEGRPSNYRTGSSAGLMMDSGRGYVGDEAWSIQVGTQLKVNDDGRERNPEQFYVRDESRDSNNNNNRRYSSSYY